MIIDRRKDGRGRSAENRKRFIERYKSVIKEQIEEDVLIQGDKNDIKIDLMHQELEEYTFQYDEFAGNQKTIYAENDYFCKGDKVDIISDKSEKKMWDGISQDGFIFTLTKEEFFDIYFSDMALPKFIKNSIRNTVAYKYQRAGYSKDGIPARLDLLKTLKQAKARRKATHSTRFLEDIDMKYKYYAKRPYPIRHAVMFMIMDVSGSMEEWHKTLAKKFFLLLSLFLQKEYESVELVFIRHTTIAEETEEVFFFYGTMSGGTVVSTGLTLVNEIIDERYDVSTTNIYVAQASDGDTWGGDNKECLKQIECMLPKIQYFAYVQIQQQEHIRINDSIMATYASITNEKLNSRLVTKAEDIFPVLHDLFKKSGENR